MSISILYHQSTADFCYPEKTLYHLSIDKAVSYFCIDTVKRKSFLSILSAPLLTETDIVFRQDVLQDLFKNPSIVDELLSLLSRFSEVYAAQKASQSDRLRISANNNDSLSTAKNILQNNALALKRSLLFVKAMHDVLENADIRSEGLARLKNALAEHHSEPAYSEMLQYCSSFEYFKTSGTLDVKLHISDDGRFDAFDLIEHRYVNISDPDLKKKGLFGRPKKDEPEYHCSRVIPRPTDNIEILFLKAINEISDTFGKLSRTLFDRFLGLTGELTFYQTAIEYINMLQSKGVSMCYPQISENEQNTNVSELYDLFLIASRDNVNSVVPNDFVLSDKNKGVLLFGNNGSGKTVFLRSIATMQIFAQAGLPIPAKNATLPIYRQTVTQFSEAEKEFAAGNDAGRFEQEVRELAYMVDNLHSKSLVFLNETFQTTAYEEGATGLYHILNFFSKKDIKFICVTHLRQLEKRFDNDEVARLHTEKGYKIANCS